MNSTIFPRLALLCSVLATASSQLLAADFTIPNTFQSGTAAVAAEVNENFTAAKTAIDDNHSQITALEATITNLETLVSDQAALITSLQNSIANLQTTVADLQASDNNQDTSIASLQSDLTGYSTDINQLQTDVTAIESSEVLQLESYLTIDTNSNPFGPVVVFSGVNLQVNNGLGVTFSDPAGGQNPNGLGNIIIGYDEAGGLSKANVCSYGIYLNEFDCTSNGFTWGDDQKSGSHYLVMGEHNNYTQSGGIISGRNNTSNNIGASTNAGAYNIASGEFTATLSGARNIVAGENAAAVGGFRNEVYGLSAATVSGVENAANGIDSATIGGTLNTANGDYSVITGGENNITSGTSASVGGGQLNTASGLRSVVVGGSGNTAAGTDSITP